MIDVEAVWQARAELGEGPVWVAGEQSIYWVDIRTHRVFRYHTPGGAQTTWQFDQEITSLAPRACGGFLATTRDGFATLDLANTRVTELRYVEQNLPGNRFNDGKVDASGRFWAGSMDERELASNGALYLLNSDLECRRKDTGYIISNGPAFNRANDLMYHTETKEGRVYVFDLSPEGELGNKRLFTAFTPDQGLPDGMTVDAQDCLWIAQFGGFGISRFSPDGELIDKLDIPSPNVTSCTFAGEDLDTLYITTARCAMSEEQLEQYPLAGSLFRCRPGVRGLPSPLFLD